MAGFPGSGKSFFCSSHLEPLGFVTANRDKMGAWQKCVALMEKSLQVFCCLKIKELKCMWKLNVKLKNPK